MGFWQSSTGEVQVKIVSAEIPRILDFLIKQDIPLSKIEYIDDFTVTFWISVRYLHHIKAICRKKDISYSVEGQKGIYWVIQFLRKRPLLLVNIITLLFLTLFIPRYIFFFSVEGNVTLPDRLILEAADSCGIRFGISRKQIRSEKMKNALLEALPELQWAGINTKGCTATISVQERASPPKTDPPYKVTKIVSDQDAIILSCTANHGNLLCKPGQAVKAGQTLISGYTDVGLTTLAGSAKGEIIGKTKHELQVIIPLNRIQRINTESQKEKISIIIGKNRINLWDTRGLSYGECGKISKTYPLCLFGKFLLPFRLEIETYFFFQGKAALPIPEENVYKFCESYIVDHAIAGKVTQSNYQQFENNGCLYIDAQFSCEEMIGREQAEELIYYEQKYRTNR